MKIKHSLIILLSTLLLVGCGGGGGSTTTAADTVADTTAPQNSRTESVVSEPFPAPLLTDDIQTAYLKVINDARSVQQDCGTEGIFPPAAALKWSDKLYTASYEHSTDMAQSNTFSHDGSGTDSDWTGVELGKASSVSERLENNGYTNWKKVGENIAAGTNRNTAQGAVDAWLASDPHCAALMDPGYTEVGMAMVEESRSDYTYYWTQDFGNR